MSSGFFFFLEKPFSKNIFETSCIKDAFLEVASGVHFGNLFEKDGGKHVAENFVSSIFQNFKKKILRWKQVFKPDLHQP